MRRQRFLKLSARVLVLVFLLLLILVLLDRMDAIKGNMKVGLLIRLKPGLFKPPGKRGGNGSRASAGPCDQMVTCPEEQLSFYLRSGAASAVAPKICVNNKLVLGTVLNNAGRGLNIVVLDGRSGHTISTAHFNMYSGDVNPLIKLLKNLGHGSAVLMASFDDPATKLTDEARKLISELGSSLVQTLGFRDNWIFVGGKGITGKTEFEKHIKNDKKVNKYQGWPELVEMHGCLPKYQS